MEIKGTLPQLKTTDLGARLVARSYNRLHSLRKVLCLLYAYHNDSALHGCNCKVCESTTIKRKKGEIHIDRIVISKGHGTSPNPTQLLSLKGTHNQSQSIQTQIIKSLFSIQICSLNLTLGTVKV